MRATVHVCRRGGDDGPVAAWTPTITLAASFIRPYRQPIASTSIVLILLGWLLLEVLEVLFVT